VNSELVYREVSNEGTSLLQAYDVVSAVTTLVNVECELFIIRPLILLHSKEGQKSAALLFPFC